MSTVPIRDGAKLLLELDALLIFGARLFMQLDSESDFAQIFSEASGLSIIATEFIALWYPLNRLSLKWASAGKIRHLATTALSSLAAGFLAVHIVLPFAGFPLGSSILATLLLQLGLFLILPVPVLLILRRVHCHSTHADSMNDSVPSSQFEDTEVTNDPSTELPHLILYHTSNLQNQIPQGLYPTQNQPKQQPTQKLRHRGNHPWQPANKQEKKPPR